MDMLPPSIAGNVYRLGKRVGKGAFGTVFLGSDSRGDEFAVKVVQLRPKYKPFVKLELIMNYILQHPNIIRAHDIVIHDQQVAIVMKFMPTCLLELLRDKTTCLDFSEWFGLIHQLVSAVQYMHHHGIVHRDIKLDNILLDKGQIQLIDMGSAASAGGSGKGLCGSPHYVSPELLMCRAVNGDFDKINHYKVDVWGIGIVMYALMFRKLPFTGQDDEVGEKILMDRLLIPSHTFDKRWIGLLEGMLAKKPRKRPTVDQITKLPVWKDACSKFSLPDKIEKVADKCKLTGTSYELMEFIAGKNVKFSDPVFRLRRIVSVLATRNPDLIEQILSI